MPRIHLISGLPRSGSALLRQNPRFQADSSPIASSVGSLLGALGCAHNFAHIDYATTAFDLKAGTPGLYVMRSNVEAIERDTSPPPNLFRRFENGAFLRNSVLNRRGTHRMDTRRHSLSEYRNIPIGPHPP
ncbi:hypothetical protein B1A_19035, partial [mine drainage metagenome]